MRVAVICETSGKVREAFRKLGHDAVSVDVLPADDRSAYHYVADALAYLAEHEASLDLVVAHPPCTYLCNSGVQWLTRTPKMPKAGTQWGVPSVDTLF